MVRSWRVSAGSEGGRAGPFPSVHHGSHILLGWLWDRSHLTSTTQDSYTWMRSPLSSPSTSRLQGAGEPPLMVFAELQRPG